MNLESVNRATTSDELKGIYRFRYTVYVEELKREIGGVDHAGKMVTDAEDEADYSHHFYVGTPDNIAGTVRLRIWKPGEIPEYDFKQFSLDIISGIESMTVSEIGRFMIHPKRRGALVLPAMARAAYEFQARDMGVDLALCYCRPGLVNYYRRLGARPYGGRMVDAPEGMEVPLVSVLSDRHYYKAVKSPLTSYVRKCFGPGKRTPLDIGRFAHLFDDDAQPIVTDKRKIWEEMNETLLDNTHTAGTFLDGLSDAAIQKLAGSGFIMDVPSGTLVTRAGHTEREMYVVLDGSFEVFNGEQVYAQLGRGDVFGEAAFFRDSGKRSASVRATRTGRLVTLRRKFLDELGKSDPASAQQILFNLAKILSERLASSNALTFATHREQLFG